MALTDDDSDIRSLSPGGTLTITDRTGILGGVTFEARSVNGQIERKWSGLNGESQRRKWLSDHLLELARSSGFAADSRVARILKQSGPDGVLQEISRISSDHARRIYFQRLLETGSLDAPSHARLIAQAGREMRSAYDLAAVLTAAVHARPLDATTRGPFFQAFAALSSDYERRRVLTAVVNQTRIDNETIVALLQAAAQVRSAYDRASVLTAVAGKYALQGQARDAYLAAARGISSRYEQDRALAALTRSEMR